MLIDLIIQDLLGI